MQGEGPVSTRPHTSPSEFFHWTTNQKILF